MFGGRAANVALASNYQLKGVVMASNPADSAAIIGIDGKPAQSWNVGQQLQSGVTIKEVHASYIVLNEGGLMKRVELPETAMPVSGAGIPPVSVNQGMPANGLPQVMPNQNNPGMQPAPVTPPVAPLVAPTPANRPN
jgi:general secretion pathway protein C